MTFAALQGTLAGPFDCIRYAPFRSGCLLAVKLVIELRKGLIIQ